jgi:hypothetical protein
MSEYGYEDYGVDEGYDPNEIAQAAAEQVAAAYAPVIGGLQQQVQQLGGLVAATAQQQDWKFEQEQQTTANEALKAAEARHPWMGSPENRKQFGAFLEERTELLPPRLMESGDRDSMVQAIDAAAQEYEREQALESARANERRAQAHIDDINKSNFKW